METKLIELYLLICHLYDTKPVLKQQRLSNNHQPLFSDEELLTMYLFGHLQGLTTQRRIYDYVCNHWREWFPALPAHQTVNCRLNELAPAFELLIEQLLISGAWHITATADPLIDSVPVMLACGTRANRGRVAPAPFISSLLAIQEFPEDDQLAFRSLLHSPAELLHLIKGEPVGERKRGRTKQERINAPVWFRADETVNYEAGDLVR